MKYQKVIEPSGRESIFMPLKPKDPKANPPVVDMDLPEPTLQESDSDPDQDDDEDQLTRQQQKILNSLNRDDTIADLETRFKANPSLNLEDLDENLFVVGQLPRGTPVEPMTDPDEQEAIEKTWSNRVLLSVLSAENALSPDSGDASKASDDSKLASYKYNSRFMQENFYQKYYLFNTEIATYEQRLNFKKITRLNVHLLFTYSYLNFK